MKLPVSVFARKVRNSVSLVATTIWVTACCLCPPRAKDMFCGFEKCNHLIDKSYSNTFFA